jgi:carboxyl-terminal processing protease
MGDLVLTPPADVIGPLGSVATIEVQGSDGARRSVQGRREDPWWPPEHPSLRWRTILRRPGECIGYPKASRFDDDTAALVDLAMADLKDTSGLIIDIRDNSGGNLSFLRLTSYLVPGQDFAFALLTRPFLDKRKSDLASLDVTKLPKVVAAYTTAQILGAMKRQGGAAAFYAEDVGDKVYRGKVVLLINQGTASAAEGFALYMKARSQATLVGATSAGAILGSERFALKGGWQLTVPTHVGLGSDGKMIKDTPTAPHVEVRWKLRDVWDGRDPDIAKALDILEGNK